MKDTGEEKSSDYALLLTVYLTACVGSLLSVALFDCIFSIGINFGEIAFTRFIFQTRYIFGYYNTQRLNSFNEGGLPPVALRSSKELSHHAA